MPTETVLESNDIETVAPARVGDTLGYARVSTHDQNPDAQSDRLIEAGARTKPRPSRLTSAPASTTPLSYF